MPARSDTEYITPEKVVSEDNITGEQEQPTITSTGRR